MMTFEIRAIVTIVGTWLVSGGIVMGLIVMGLSARRSSFVATVSAFLLVVLAVVGTASLLQLAWG